MDKYKKSIPLQESYKLPDIDEKSTISFGFAKNKNTKIEYARIVMSDFGGNFDVIVKYSLSLEYSICGFECEINGKTVTVIESNGDFIVMLKNSPNMEDICVFEQKKDVFGLIIRKILSFVNGSVVFVTYMEAFLEMCYMCIIFKNSIEFGDYSPIFKRFFQTRKITQMHLLRFATDESATNKRTTNKHTTDTTEKNFTNIKYEIDSNSDDKTEMSMDYEPMDYEDDVTEVSQ